MADYPLFLSIVLVARNSDGLLRDTIAALALDIGEKVNDYEVLIVDNGSDDESLRRLKEMLRGDSIPNVQVLALTKEVAFETAAWAGVEHALGDFVAVVDPLRDDAHMLAPMLAKAATGYEVVFGQNRASDNGGWWYRRGVQAFDQLYAKLHGVRLSIDAPHFRLISRSVVNYIQRHGSPEVAYRHLPATAGFSKAYVTGEWRPHAPRKRSLLDGIDRGLLLLVSSTPQPMRLVTTLALLGAMGNIFYSIYVVVVALFKAHVAEGWVTLSLQQSGMFFLLSVVLLMLGEYVTHMLSVSAGIPAYHIGQEFGSAIISRHQKLNVEETGDMTQRDSTHSASATRNA